MARSDATERNPEHAPIIKRDHLKVEQGQGDVDESNGLSVCMTTVFMVGETAGIGLLAVPKAVDSAGYVGIVFFAMATATVAYTALVLGRSWVLVQERYPEFRGTVRFPYPAIGQVTYGTPGRLVVSFCVSVSMYGAGIVILLLCAEDIQDMVCDIGLNLSFDGWIVVVAAVIAPMTWFGTPKDFWFIAVGTFVVMSVACVLLLANITMDGVYQNNVNVTVQHSVPSFITTCMSFGPIWFGMAGHPVFPTLQNDMKDPTKFANSVYFSYMIILSMYLSVLTAAHFVYGGNVQANILLTVSNGPMLYIVQILITAHLLLGFVILMNPVCQEIEEIIGVPKHFTWKRCLSRSTAVVLAMLIAVSVHSFGVILSLVGGSTMALLTVICPLMFFHKLSSTAGEWEQVTITVKTKILNYTLTLGGVVTGVLCTFSSVVTLLSGHVQTAPLMYNHSQISD